MLVQAEETQNQLAEDTFETSQDLAKARHEQRLENQMASESLEELADATKSTALDQIPETGQALENQALANQLEELAETAKKLSTDLRDQEPSGDEQVAAELSDEVKSTEKLLKENPTFENFKTKRNPSVNKQIPLKLSCRKSPMIFLPKPRKPKACQCFQ